MISTEISIYELLMLVGETCINAPDKVPLYRLAPTLVHDVIGGGGLLVALKLCWLCLQFFRCT